MIMKSIGWCLFKYVAAEMGVLLRTLFMFNEEKKAGKLQKKLEDLIECVDQAIPLIWTGRNSSANNDSDMV